MRCLSMSMPLLCPMASFGALGCRVNKMKMNPPEDGVWWGPLLAGRNVGTDTWVQYQTQEPSPKPQQQQQQLLINGGVSLRGARGNEPLCYSVADERMFIFIRIYELTSVKLSHCHFFFAAPTFMLLPLAFRLFGLTLALYRSEK